MKKLFFCVLVLVLLLSNVLQAGAAQFYTVHARLFDSENEIAEPVMMIKSGVEAKVSEDGRYSLSLMATPSGESRVYLKANLQLGDRAYTPSILVKLGGESKVTMGEATLILKIDKF